MLLGEIGTVYWKKGKMARDKGTGPRVSFLSSLKKDLRFLDGGLGGFYLTCCQPANELQRVQCKQQPGTERLRCR